MSEFGSSKSFSSVSESSASAPPSSSSSEELHTCHHCSNAWGVLGRNACYSDKSRLVGSFKQTEVTHAAGNDCSGEPISTVIWDIENFNIPFVSSVANRIFYAGPVTYTKTEGGSPSVVSDEILVIQIICLGDINGISIRLENSQGQITKILMGVVVAGDDRVTDACHYNLTTSRCLGDTLTESVEVSIEVTNNPCCWDTIGVGCFQHFGGDCRGNCDEEPSSGSSASSSEENPLP